MNAWETDREDANNRRKAMIITFIVNLLVITALYFIVVWRQPVPPIPQFGLELNLGFTDTGSGNVQTTAPPAETREQVTEAPAPGEQAQQVTQAAVPKAAPETSVARPAPAQSQRQVETQSRVESPLKGAETTAEAVKESAKPTQTPPATAPSTAEAPKTETKAAEKPTVDPRAIFGAGGTTGTGNQPSSGSSQGSSNRPGDEGNPQGTVDGRSILQSGRGNAGDGAGYNLDLAGWDFASKPNIQDRVSTRNGRIVFRITVDQDGRIQQAIPLEYNVSNEVLSYYRTVVNQLSFKRQSGNPTADFSTGRITFIIKVD
ncbi:MAG: energy transducer TonB [Lunatimonas sp.]|uniref:energy transducer TonB n=1 Tax=Lunatimonas sp. TaxID=2060141 RepID=UPI00263BABBF|nr:energy transducer TonB [Lunatimonas sp.]MCC5936668.1 energy transducer TonB [Lunatimonas sp.]